MQTVEVVRNETMTISESVQYHFNQKPVIQLGVDILERNHTDWVPVIMHDIFLSTINEMNNNVLCLILTSSAPFHTCQHQGKIDQFVGARPTLEFGFCTYTF